MNEFKLQDDDRSWLQAYQSICLFAFFVDRYQNHEEQINLFDAEYNKFLEAKSYPKNGSLSIIDMPTFEALVFITLSRIHEYIQFKTKNDKCTRDRFYESVLSHFLEKTNRKENNKNVKNYSTLIKFYEFCLQTDDYSEKSDEERLYQLVRAIRCKIVHFDNESDSETIRIAFKDTIESGDVKNLTFKISFAQLINFSLHFAICVNSVLHAD